MQEPVKAALDFAIDIAMARLFFETTDAKSSVSRLDAAGWQKDAVGASLYGIMWDYSAAKAATIRPMCQQANTIAVSDFISHTAWNALSLIHACVRPARQHTDRIGFWYNTWAHEPTNSLAAFVHYGSPSSKETRFFLLLDGTQITTTRDHVAARKVTGDFHRDHITTLEEAGGYALACEARGSGRDHADFEFNLHIVGAPWAHRFGKAKKRYAGVAIQAYQYCQFL